MKLTIKALSPVLALLYSSMYAYTQEHTEQWGHIEIRTNWPEKQELSFA